MGSEKAGAPLDPGRVASDEGGSSVERFARIEGGEVVECFSDKVFAEAAASLLESEGIASEILSDDAGHELPNLDFAAGVRVIVSAEDAERARDVLNAAAGEAEGLAEVE